MTISNTSRGLRPGVCLSTNRPANPFDGQVIYETDTDLVKAFNGTDFVTVGPGGLELISATTIGSAVSTLLIDDVFSADFLVYRANITVTATSGQTQFNLRFRVSGADNTTANYCFYNRVSSSATGADTNTFNRAQTSATIMGVNTDLQGFNLDIQRPFVAAPTYINLTATGNVGNMVTGVGSFNASTSFTGFSLIASAGTMSAAITVYGYRD